MGATAPGARTGRRRRACAAGLLGTLLLAACDAATGSAPTAPAPSSAATPSGSLSSTTPAAPSTGAPSASPTPSTSATPAPTPGSTPAQPAAVFGVDKTRWPGTLRAARELVQSLPRTVAEQQRDVYSDAADDNEGPEVGARYGDLAIVRVVEAYAEGGSSGTGKKISAGEVLAATFAPYGCVEGTYRGNVPQQWEGGGPRRTSGRFVWFSCTVDTGEGAESPGRAVGWTAGETAWLVAAQTPRGARALVGALKDAAE